MSSLFMHWILALFLIAFALKTKVEVIEKSVKITFLNKFE